jgi:hypothetical protein
MCIMGCGKKKFRITPRMNNPVFVYKDATFRMHLIDVIYYCLDGSAAIISGTLLAS